MASPPDRRISDCIGNTPLLRIHLFEDEAPDLLVLGKAEFMNPGGSVKDRPALRMVQEAQRSGQLGRGQVLLDSTSGNTGVAYAMLGAALGFPALVATLARGEKSVPARVVGLWPASGQVRILPVDIEALASHADHVAVGAALGGDLDRLLAAETPQGVDVVAHELLRALLGDLLDLNAPFNAEDHKRLLG